MKNVIGHRNDLYGDDNRRYSVYSKSVYNMDKNQHDMVIVPRNDEGTVINSNHDNGNDSLSTIGEEKEK